MTESTVSGLSLLQGYFADLTSAQYNAFEQMLPLYRQWNDKINVISRKDIEQLYVRHVLHSMAMAKIVQFRPGASVLDVGTGGGFPGIPLAIMFPQTTFHLVDSIGKKIKVVADVATRLNLQNVKATHSRAEQVSGQYDFVVSRAVTQMDTFYGWVKNKVSRQSNHSIPNGILYLKGGDVQEEMARLGKPYQVYDLCDFFEEPFFETKKLIAVPVP